MKRVKIARFDPILKKALWGTESWEISAFLSNPSIFSCGFDAGASLSDVIPGFPLLFKVIDAKDRLSVQVHPCEASAPIVGGDPKTEMWYLLEDGLIFAGLKPGAGAADVEKAVRDGSFEDVLVRHEAKKGECFFIPGGLVHAIAEGTRVYEVQQSSDTTYRLYDWNRVDAAGKSRELHLEKGLKAIDYTLPVPRPAKDVTCPFFTFRPVGLDGERTVAVDGFLALFNDGGTLVADGVEIPEQTSALAYGKGDVTLRGSARVLTTVV